MKRILTIAAAVVFFTNLNVYAVPQDYVFLDAEKAPEYMQSIQITNLPYGVYLKFYNINTQKIAAGFVNLSKMEEDRFLKTLSKEDKNNYKYVKKIQKIISEGDWNKVFTKYPNYLPAYLQYYDMVYQKGNYNEALRILQKIKTLDRNSQIFGPQLVNQSFGILYFVTGQYTTALNYFKLYENTNDEFIISSIANCYYALGNYVEAINYAKKLTNPQYQDTELLFGAYYRIKDYQVANKYANELLKQNYSFENLMRVQQTTSDDVKRLEYCYKARSLAQNDTKIYDVNFDIAELEQKKLDKAASKFAQFIKVPKWSDFEKQIPENVSESEVSQKQDEFFKNANMYLTKYTGQQLTNAFNSLNQDYNNYIQNKKTEYYQEKQLQAQKALIIEQQRNNWLQQQMLYEQQIRNYLERQYYLMRPYYVHPRMYGWW
ncbi:MAG: tetratricopeptide repeat protein [Candidatus Gastranaerophilaceae bacterium]